MKAKAPGKVVLSGAYSVLEGAPALVAAVDRYVEADTERAAARLTEEMAAAIRLGYATAAPWFDAAALRTSTSRSSTGGRKLGLGSSAAIVVASLGAIRLAEGVSDANLAATVLPAALEAHRNAQGGGSGIDVAASCYGGILACRRVPTSAALDVEPFAVPDGVVLEVFAAATAASTPELLGRVQAYARREPGRYQQLLAEASSGAAEAAKAVRRSPWIAGLERQRRALDELGQAAAAPIVTQEVRELAALARRAGSYFGPAGAGGGDIALYAGSVSAPPDFRARASALGLTLLELRLGARGLHGAGR